VRVYGSIPKGSKLNRELLRAAEQIYPHERGLILLYNDSKNSINSGYYLLFFDSSSKLEGACYLSKLGLKEFSENNLTSYLAPVYEERKSSRGSDLPENIRLTILKCGYGIGANKKKVITNLEVINSENSNSLILKVKFYQGKRPVSLGTGESGPDDSEIILDLRDIHIGENSIYTIECISEAGYVVYNHYMFLPGKLDELYVNIFKKFNVPADNKVD